MTRIPGCIWMPATATGGGQKFYPRPLSAILYTVNHDALGYRGYLERGHALRSDASWLISNLIDGTRLQHFELEEGTWTQSGRVQNTAGVATEHENKRGLLRPSNDPITPAQVIADLETEAFLDSVCPNLRPPVYGQGRREHRDFVSTGCPNGRIQPLYNSTAPKPPPPEEDDMPSLEEIRRLIQEETDSKRPVYRFKDKDGKTWGHIFSLDSASGRLVHEINPTAYLGTGSAFTDAITLEKGNKDHEELLRLPVLFPKGLTQLADHVKKR